MTPQRAVCIGSRLNTWTLEFGHFLRAGGESGYSLIQVEPGSCGRVAHLFSGSPLALASRVPARAELSPRSAPSTGFLDRPRNSHLDPHSGKLRVRPTGLERRIPSASPE